MATENGTEMDDDHEHQSIEVPEASPFAPEQSAWLAKAVSSTMQHFGGHVDARLVTIEEHIKTADEHTKVLKQGIDTLRQELKDAEPPDYASKIAELDAALEEIRRAKTDQTERDRKWQVEKDRVNEALAQLQRREALSQCHP